jgi:sugar/nucleoside kinase (ribokinase family)
VAISDDGERSVVHSFGANASFCFEDIDLSILDETKILFIGGTLLMPSFDGEGTAKLLKLAKEKDILCCMDTAWDSTGKWIETIGCSLKHLDWFMPSIDEAVCLAGGERKPEKIADIFIDYGVKNIVIKLGKDGCYVKTAKEEFYSKGFNKIKAVDASGAGDSFCAGFLAGLSHGWALQKCAQFANAVGTHCVMEIGTTTGIKSIKEIQKFIELYEV